MKDKMTTKKILSIPNYELDVSFKDNLKQEFIRVVNTEKKRKNFLFNFKIQIVLGTLVTIIILVSVILRSVGVDSTRWNVLLNETYASNPQAVFMPVMNAIDQSKDIDVTVSNEGIPRSMDLRYIPLDVDTKKERFVKTTINYTFGPKVDKCEEFSPLIPIVSRSETYEYTEPDGSYHFKTEAFDAEENILAEFYVSDSTVYSRFGDVEVSETLENEQPENIHKNEFSEIFFKAEVQEDDSLVFKYKFDCGDGQKDIIILLDVDSEKRLNSTTVYLDEIKQDSIIYMTSYEIQNIFDTELVMKVFTR